MTDSNFRARLFADLKKQPHESYLEPVYKYAEHVITCPNCDPPNHKVCDEGAALATEVVMLKRE